MKNKLIILITVLFALNLAGEENRIISFKLSSEIAYTIYCNPKDTGPCTVVFPGPINYVGSAKVIRDENVASNKGKMPFSSDWVPGNNFFTIKAYHDVGAKAQMNIIYDSKVYIIDLEIAESGYRSVTFNNPKPLATDVSRSIPATPKVLISLLDKSKSYHLMKKEYPEQIDDLTYYAPKEKFINYGTHMIQLLEVIGHPRVDTIYFRVRLHNNLDKSLYYDPKHLAVSLSNKKYYSSLSDASGALPPKGITEAWFAITGDSEGGRNNLQAENEWNVLLPVFEKPSIQKNTTPLTKSTNSAPMIEKEKPGIKRIKTIPRIQVIKEK